MIQIMVILPFNCFLAVLWALTGGLSILETERRLVTEEVWSKLRAYFPKAPQFTQQQEPCQQCLVRIGWHKQRGWTVCVYRWN